MRRNERTCSCSLPTATTTITPTHLSVCLPLSLISAYVPHCILRCPGPPVWYSEAGIEMPVSISSPCLSVKESKKNPSVCLKMLIPLNGSEIAGEQGGIEGGGRKRCMEKGVVGAVLDTPQTGGWRWWRSRVMGLILAERIIKRYYHNGPVIQPCLYTERKSALPCLLR